MVVRFIHTCYMDFKKSFFFYISLVAAVITSFWHIPKWQYIDFTVIIFLFELMIVIKAIEEIGILRHIAIKAVNSCKDARRLTQVLSLIAFFIAMFVTNDVAVLTIIPIVIFVSHKGSYLSTLPYVLVTIASNLGSSITPIGNPQNIYLYSFYQLDFFTFSLHALPLFFFSIVLILAITFLIKPQVINLNIVNTVAIHSKYLSMLIVLSIIVICLGAVIPKYITVVVIILLTFFIDKKLLLKVDYRLLLTFVFLFIAIGNVTNTELLMAKLPYLMQNATGTYLSSLLLSQVISNVPSIIMLAPFSHYAYALYYGVNIGGLGTPVASLASVITFTLFGNAYPKRNSEFVWAYVAVNLLCLIILGIIFYILCG